MNRRISLSTLVIGALIAAAACDDPNGSPTAPSSIAGPSAQATPLTIAIIGNTSIDHPGETIELTASASFSDGTTRDVTTQAQWLVIDDGILTLASPGRMTAQRYGTTTVSVSYGTRGSGVSARADLRVAPQGTYLLSGVLKTDTGFPLPQSRVEAASRAGTMSTTADGYGFYAVPAAGEAVIHVEKEGFRAAVKELTVSCDDRMDFQLQRDDAGGPRGIYVVTFTASASCQLPPETMQRTYQANIEEIDHVLLARTEGADFVAWGGEKGFTGTHAGQAVEFLMRDTYDDGYNLIERIPSLGDLHYSGIATGTISEADIVATFRGTLRLVPFRSAGIPGTCTADDHRMRLVRIGS
jgi:hypothetical protein